MLSSEGQLAMPFNTEEVRRALRAGEFVPWFQPLVGLQTGQLSGFEVLARWNHRTAGLIPPDIFIPCSERDGWIDDLTSNILGKAFTVARSLPVELSLSINISPLQLHDNRLPARLEQLSEEAGFPLGRVIVEITESALANDIEWARKVANELKSLGCRLALDDFGIGYSSLRNLQSLPFDELKVDKSFIGSMVQQRESRKIVAAIVGLGQSLELTTVAEGVETAEQAEMLHWLGCDIVQGWLCGRAMPAEHLAEAIVSPRSSLPSHPAFPSANASTGCLEGMPAQRLAHLQAIYDGAPVGLAFLDRSLRYIALNRQLAELNAKPVAEHLGRTPADITPELFPVFAPYLRSALQGQAISGCEIRQPAVSGRSTKTYLASYQPARDEAGEVVGVSLAVLDFTERKQAEERLKQYERVVEGLQDMVVVVDRNYRYVLANRAFLSYREISREELVGRLVADVTDPEVFERVVKEKLDACFAGNVVQYELTYKYPALGERDLCISYFPVEVSGGIMGAACVLRDVTELRQMERINQDWQHRIRLAQASGLRIGLWDWDIVTNTVIWSDETYRQWGTTREQFSGRVDDVLARVHPDDRLNVRQAIARVLSGKDQQYACQYRVVRPDGSTCWIDASGVVVQNGSTHMTGVGVDITHLKAVEQSLQESEEKYLLLLNSTAEAIYGVDLDGNCTFCNPAGLRALGYRAQEDVLGRNMHWLVHHSHKNGKPYPIEKCAIFAAIRNGTGTHCDTEVMWRSDGASFPVEYWSYPMFRSGELVGAVVTFLEISGPRRKRQELSAEPEAEEARWPPALASR